MNVTRRELFGIWRRKQTAPGADADVAPERVPVPARPPATAPTAAPPAFSLDGFYRQRATAPVLPVFAVRAPTSSETTATTQIGVGPRAAASAAPTTAASAASAASPASAASAAVAIPTAMVPSVLVEACLATRSFCSVCVERCPLPGAIVVSGGRPRIVPEACDGCGRCVAACPAPVLALALVARAEPLPAGPP